MHCASFLRAGTFLSAQNKQALYCLPVVRTEFKFLCESKQTAPSLMRLDDIKMSLCRHGPAEKVETDGYDCAVPVWSPVGATWRTRLPSRPVSAVRVFIGFARCTRGGDRSGRDRPAESRFGSRADQSAQIVLRSDGFRERLIYCYEGRIKHVPRGIVTFATCARKFANAEDLHNTAPIGNDARFLQLHCRPANRCASNAKHDR